MDICSMPDGCKIAEEDVAPYSDANHDHNDSDDTHPSLKSESEDKP